MREMRKHAGWYLKGMPGSASLRNDVNQEETLLGMEALLRRLWEEV